jgi:hypothetical protein
VRRSDLSGKRLAGWMHLLPDTILTLMPFVEAGVSVRVGACNPDSTDPRVVDYLARHGVEVFDGRREPRHIYDDTLRRFAAGPLDAICDMGGELIEAATLAGTSVAGALEATTTGLHRIRPLHLAFPVFDWNGIALKDALHNRFHVGEATWPAFEGITGSRSSAGESSSSDSAPWDGASQNGRATSARSLRSPSSIPSADSRQCTSAAGRCRSAPRSRKQTSSSPRPASMASSAKRS